MPCYNEHSTIFKLLNDSSVLRLKYFSRIKSCLVNSSVLLFNDLDAEHNFTKTQIIISEELMSTVKCLCVLFSEDILIVYFEIIIRLKQQRKNDFMFM